MRDSNECNPVECCLEMCCQILVYPLLEAALNCCAEECRKCCDETKTEVNTNDDYSPLQEPTAPIQQAMSRDTFFKNSVDSTNSANPTNSSEKESIVATTSDTAQPH